MRTLSGPRIAAVALTLSLGAVTAPAMADQVHPDGQSSESSQSTPAVRFQTFNASLNRSAPGELVEDLSTPDDPQAAAVAEIIQRTRPDVLLLNEFDYVPDGRAVDLFRDNYLEVGHNGAAPIHYGYSFIAPSNTGIPSGHDLDNNGTIGGGNDAFGFGDFEGQYGMAVLSRFPIDAGQARTFQHFRWRDMPGAMLPDDPATPEPADWYSAEELDDVRLSSKSHWDLPIRIGHRTVHFLVSHPTPPVFDVPEDRNGTRNHDEIRFWADYVSGQDYMYDDAGAPRRAGARCPLRDRGRPEQRPARRRLGAGRGAAADRSPADRGPAAHIRGRPGGGGPAGWRQPHPPLGPALRHRGLRGHQPRQPAGRLRAAGPAARSGGRGSVLAGA
jgi:hypothetical protein